MANTQSNAPRRTAAPSSSKPHPSSKQKSNTSQRSAGTSQSLSSSSAGKKKSHILKKGNRPPQTPHNRPGHVPSVQRRSSTTIRESDSVRLKSDHPDSNESKNIDQKWVKEAQNRRVTERERGPSRHSERAPRGSQRFIQSDQPQENEAAAPLKREAIKANPVPSAIDIMEVVTVSDLARKMNLKATDLIAKLMSMGMMVGINDQIDAETATLVASEYHCEVRIVSIYDETAISPEHHTSPSAPRPPVITIMGHVDHGKTKLLDCIRDSNVVEGEHGGITQHIAAYQIRRNNHPITFIDTPGHAAFTLMRARGAQITDIVVLVVAADDGVMPQTTEAIDHARAANVPIAVAINKIDLESSNVERVYQQLSDAALVPEEWGGNTVCCQISALRGDGVNDLIDALLVISEELELKAPQECRAQGTILESRVDHGRGIICTVLVQSGTLRTGDSFLAGIYPGRVRAMFNDRGSQIKEAPPSTPVEVLGFNYIPEAGDPFQVAASEKEARAVSMKRQELRKTEMAQSIKKMGVQEIYQTIEEQSLQEFKVIVKGDVNGSVEAIKTALERIENSKIRLSVIRTAAGNINENDVMLASASQALIVAFNVRPSAHVQKLADQEKVQIRRYSVIYAIIEEVEKMLNGMLEPTYQENHIGTVEVRNLFNISNLGTIAGSYVTKGVVRRGATAVVTRANAELFKGTISTLKRFKNDAREVESGYECGINIKGFNDLKKGDVFEIYETVETVPK